jgi:hypothetical protein
MGARLEMDAVFGSTGQAVHVAFLVMGQEATQDAPLRKALIRALESIALDGTQRSWLEQLRGTPSDSINFGGLTSTEVRAQCAMITQAVKQLPKPEMWALQAKFGHTEFEDAAGEQLPGQEPRRRYAFSAERIGAILGLSAWLQPDFPQIPGLALDCMLGRAYANHAKMNISLRDLAESFGGSAMKYQRAATRLKEKLQELEHMALARLEERFVADGVALPTDER